MGKLGPMMRRALRAAVERQHRTRAKMDRNTMARRRAGFTLIETIVTVGLLAVLAAFVIPTVVQKAVAADPVKVSNDLSSIRGGIERFASDVRAGFPRRISTLTTKPTTSDLFLDGVTQLTAAQIDAWQGPYLAAVIGATDTDSMGTAFTAAIRNRIVRFDAVNNVAEDGPVAIITGNSFDASNTLFAAVRVNGLTAAQAEMVNRMVDGAADGNLVAPHADAGANVAGRFRFNKPVAGVVTAYYLAAPITQ